MSYYDAFDEEEVPRPRPLYDPGLGGYSYRDVYAEAEPRAPFAQRMQARLQALESLNQAQRIAQSNPAAEANRRVQAEKGQKRKGLGKLLAIPELPGVRHALGALGALGQANLSAGQAARERLYDQTTVLQNAEGQEVGRKVRKGNPFAALLEAGKGYAGGLTGRRRTNVVDALGGTLAGVKLPEKGGGRIATEILGGTLSDPLAFMGAGLTGTAARTTAGAAKTVGGAQLATKLGRSGLKGLDEAERASILTQLERSASLAPTRLSRGTAAQRAGRTFEKAERFGKEGLHVNVPFVPGSRGQFSLGGGRFAEAANVIDETAGVSSRLGRLKSTETAAKLRGVTNPRAAIAAQKGEEYAGGVRDAERRAQATRIRLGEHADKVTKEILKSRRYSDEDITYVRRALDEGTDVTEMAAARPELKPLITQLHDLVRRGDQMLVDLGVNPEHLMEPGNYVPRHLTSQGKDALLAMDNAALQRLFGKDTNIQSLRQEIERGTVVKRRVFHGPLDQAERQIGAITGKKVKHFEDDPVKAILAHYKNIAGSWSQRQMLREMAEGGLVKQTGKAGNIDAGDLGGQFEGPQTLADYLNRRAAPQYQDPSAALGGKLYGGATQAWKAGALNWPGTAARDIFGNAWNMAIRGVAPIGSRPYREAKRTQKGIDWAIRNPAESFDLPPGITGPPPGLQTDLPPDALRGVAAALQPPTPGSPALRALGPGRGAIRPTPESRLRELAARPPAPGSKVHPPENLRRFFASMESGPPNSIQEVEVPRYWTGPAAEGRPLERMVVMYDNEGRPVQATSSVFEGSPDPVDTQAWGHPEFQGQGLAAGPGGLWETMLRMGIPITDQGRGGLSSAGAAGASRLRARLGQRLPLAESYKSARQPQLRTLAGGRPHGFRVPAAQAPIQGPPGPAEILAGQSKVPFEMGSGRPIPAQLSLGLDALKGQGPSGAPRGLQDLWPGMSGRLALPAGSAPPGAFEGGLDALKGLPVNPRVGESRVEQRLREIMGGMVESPALAPDEAAFALRAGQEGAMLPGFTRSMGGAAGVERTGLGRLRGRKNTLLRDLVGSERFEEKARLSMFHKLTAEGMDPNEAARAVEDAFFNYADITKSTQAARHVAPFVGFRVKNVQRTLRDLKDAPQRVALPARAQTVGMEEKERTDARRGALIEQLVANGMSVEEANAEAERQLGAPGLASVMAQGGIPIPGTDAYAKLSITSDAALEDLYLAPRIAAAVGGAKVDKNLAGDILSQAGGPGPGLAKAIAEENAGEYMFSGGPIKPGLLNNPFLANMIPQTGRLNQLTGDRPGVQKLSSALAGIPINQGTREASQVSEVYRRQEASAVNDVMDDLIAELRDAENNGQNERAAAIQAVIEHIKANPEFVDTSVGAASANPVAENPLAAMRRYRGQSMMERLTDQIRQSYAPVARR